MTPELASSVLPRFASRDPEPAAVRDAVVAHVERLDDRHRAGDGGGGDGVPPGPTR